MRGWEIDPFSSWLTCFFIEAAALKISLQTGKLVRPIIETRDSLSIEWLKPTFDLVIGNPPFGRLKLDEKTRNRFKRTLHGHANLYGIFTELAAELTRTGGIIAFLTPTSFLAGEYFKNLRSFLSSEAPPISLDLVELRKDVFEGVLQETILATYHKSGKRRASNVTILKPQDKKTVIKERAGSFTLPIESTGPWILPRTSDNKIFAKSLRLLSTRIGDWGYSISTGPLVWNRFKSQLEDKPSSENIPLIWAESVSSDGKFSYRSDRRNHRPYFKPRPKKDDWLIVKKGCVLLQRTTAKEQRRRLYAAPMPDDFVKANGCLSTSHGRRCIKGSK